jgi:hypothetical protein
MYNNQQKKQEAPNEKTLVYCCWVVGHIFIKQGSVWWVDGYRCSFTYICYGSVAGLPSNHYSLTHKPLTNQKHNPKKIMPAQKNAQEVLHREQSAPCRASCVSGEMCVCVCTCCASVPSLERLWWLREGLLLLLGHASLASIHYIHINT